jgi:hypothetical protein
MKTFLLGVLMMAFFILTGGIFVYAFVRICYFLTGNNWEESFWAQLFPKTVKMKKADKAQTSTATSNDGFAF